MDNLPEVECSIQGCRLVELDINLGEYTLFNLLPACDKYSQEFNRSHREWCVQ